MLARLGLQARMTLSYVLVTAAAVLLVEALAIAFVLPGLLGAANLESHVQVTAADIAATAYNANQAPGGSTLVLPSKFEQGISSGSGSVPAGSVRFQDSEYFRKRPRFALYPMKNAIQINDVKACIGKFGQILGSANPRLKIASGLRLSDFDPQR